MGQWDSVHCSTTNYLDGRFGPAGVAHYSGPVHRRTLVHDSRGVGLRACTPKHLRIECAHTHIHTCAHKRTYPSTNGLPRVPGSGRPSLPTHARRKLPRSGGYNLQPELQTDFFASCRTILFVLNFCTNMLATGPTEIKPSKFHCVFVCVSMKGNSGWSNKGFFATHSIEGSITITNKFEKFDTPDRFIFEFYSYFPLILRSTFLVSRSIVVFVILSALCPTPEAPIPWRPHRPPQMKLLHLSAFATPRFEKFCSNFSPFHLTNA